jgi:polyferredoxin
MADTAETNREAAIRRLKVFVPALFALGFLFFVAITIYPLAGMPASPLQPFGPGGSLLLWLAVACASGSLFALFGALFIAASASGDND